MFVSPYGDLITYGGSSNPNFMSLSSLAGAWMTTGYHYTSQSINLICPVQVKFKDNMPSIETKLIALALAPWATLQ
jgi:hypothetical protein